MFFSAFSASPREAADCLPASRAGVVGVSRRFKKAFVCGDISPSPRPSPPEGEREKYIWSYCGVVVPVSGVVSIVPDDELFIVSGVVPGVRSAGQFIPLVPVVDVPECI